LENVEVLLKRLALSLFLLTLFNSSAYAASGAGITAESIFVPLGKSGNNDYRSITILYGLQGFTELHENWRISYGVSGTFLNGYVYHVPLSVAFVPTADYKINLRPQIFAGVDAFYSNFNDFKGLRIFGHVGLALDYIFENHWFVNVGTKVYINDSFFKSVNEISLNGFNTGVVSVFGGAGYKF
jgi:hypothetical protein